MKKENFLIKSNDHGGWIVIGDTERFGKQKVLYETPFFKEGVKYLEENGISHSVQTEIKKVSDVQIGSRMFHRVHMDGGKFMGYNNRCGWEDLDIKGFELVEPLKAKRRRKDSGGGRGTALQER